MTPTKALSVKVPKRSRKIVPVAGKDEHGALWDQEKATAKVIAKLYPNGLPPTCKYLVKPVVTLETDPVEVYVACKVYVAYVYYTTILTGRSLLEEVIENYDFLCTFRLNNTFMPGDVDHITACEEAMTFEACMELVDKIFSWREVVHLVVEVPF